MARAARVLVDLFADLPVNRFGRRCLRECQQAFVAKGGSRHYVNVQVNRIRRILKWGVAEEYAPPEVLTALQAVEPSRRGHARETEPRTACPMEHVEATLAELSPVVRAMAATQIHAARNR
jgi:hypothetical protein